MWPNIQGEGPNGLYGVFYQATGCVTGRNGPAKNSGGKPGEYTEQIYGVNASKYSAIYKEGASVQSPALQVLACIRI